MNIISYLNIKSDILTPALVENGKHISYSELLILSRRFASFLIENGLKKNDRILILTNRSINSVISIVGSILSSAIYIPVDIRVPSSRLQKIIKDSNPKFIISFDMAILPNTDSIIINSKDFNNLINRNDYEQKNWEAISNSIDHDDIMYIMYTSGSTGEPKGVCILTSIKTNTPIGLRNKAIIELFYSTGMRTSELANLKIPDIDLKEQTVIIVLGKGNKTRVVPLGQHASYYIEEYLLKSRKFILKGKIKDDGYLFLTERGSKFERDTLNKCVVAQVMKNVQINKKVSCYTFRHSVASHLVKNKVDIRYVGQLLGHESLKTTQKYVHLEISDLKKMHSLYHPREKN